MGQNILIIGMIGVYLDQNILIIGMMGVFLLSGLGVIGWGIYTRLRGVPVPSKQWREDLLSWRILGPNTLPQALEDVKHCHDYLMSVSFLASGIGIVLMVAGWSIIGLLTTDTSEGTDAPTSTIFIVSVLLSFSIGLGVGAVFAAWRLRNTARRGVTYGDLRQRQVSDYRNNAFRWLAIALIAWTFGVFAFFAPHVGPTLQIDLLFTVVPVPNTLWGWSIIPAIMLLVFVLLEAVLLRIVRFSRLLMTTDATISQHADDMLRANVIGTVSYFQMIALGYLAASPFYMLSHLVWDSHYWQIGHTPYFNLLSISLFMPAAMQVVGLFIMMGRGRLGGKLSGWPWSVKPVEQVEGGQ